jgi:predicted MFS family arabinose efflux permease
MMLTPYRETLAIPGIRSLLIVATLARIPMTAATVVLTLRVTQDLEHGYGAAGLVSAAFTVGAAFGAPVLGRITDRRGLRPVLLLTTTAEAVFWSAAQTVPYPVLVVAALVGGFLTLPVFSVARQSIAALVPESQRRPAFALDSMSTELSFMAGPALGVLLATAVSARAAMLAIGAGVVLSGIALLILDPPIRAHDEEPVSATRRMPRRDWLSGRLIAVLAVSMAATLVLSGTDVAIVATLNGSGQLHWTGAVLGLWAAASLVGGFAYGAVRRPFSPLLLVGLMAVCTVPVGLGGGSWWVLALVLLPAGALCAPSITATADAVSRMAPPSVRGEAMGLHNSSLTVGVALGAPITGAVMDASSPAWGFVAAGGISGLIALAVLPFVLHGRRGAAVSRAPGGRHGTGHPDPGSSTEPAELPGQTSERVTAP